MSNEQNEESGQGVSRRGFAAVPLGATLALGGASFMESKAMADTTVSGARLSAEDRLDIIDLFARYSWCYDCSDAEGYAATFTPDGVIEAFGAEAARGRGAIAVFVKKLIASNRGDNDWQHLNNHHHFRATPEGATVYSYWTVIEGNEAEKRHGVHSFGYYVTDCVKQGGEWFIKKRSINRWNRDQVPWERA